MAGLVATEGTFTANRHAAHTLHDTAALPGAGRAVELVVAVAIAPATVVLTMTDAAGADVDVPQEYTAVGVYREHGFYVKAKATGSDGANLLPANVVTVKHRGD